MRRTALLVAALPLTLGVAGTARGQAQGEDVAFGSTGQIAISDDLQLAATQLTVEGSAVKPTDVELAPAADLFPAPGLSVGGQLIIGYTFVDQGDGTSRTSNQLGVFVRAGYAIALSSTASIWPRIAVGYRHSSGDVTTGLAVTMSRVQLAVQAPVLFRLAPHFFIGGGPTFSTDLSATQDGASVWKTTIIGLQSTLGGYFQGP